ncbi:MAG: prolyl oligopeptidase family serine peptidase [Acidobacteriota bacterium]|nr:prolyl oligopeptidase family serine peptidase [Acidobacteriota bacterium]
MIVSRRGFVEGSAAAMALLLAGCGGSKDDVYEVAFGATVTDAGQYVDRMIVDFGEDTVSGIEDDTFSVLMTSTVDYGEEKGNPYAYYDASVPLEVVKTETDGGKVTVYFNQSQAPTLTWLAEGRNYPAVLGFTIEQSSEITKTTKDGRELGFTGEYTSAATSYQDLECPEVAAFEGVEVEINYQFHKGTNDKLIVWFHGNGEGDFPTKDTNNNIAQILANRGGAAWVTEAQEVFGDASVMCFQAPDMWYFAVKDNLLETCHDEIQKVIDDNGIDPDEIYLSGCSAGGFMSTRMIIAYPDLFKAAMICCPALDAANVRSETDGVETTEQAFDGAEGIASGFTTYETADNRHKLSLYETFELAEIEGISGDKRQGGKIKCVEDYDQDGEPEEVMYNDHWSWVFALRNDPQAADGTHLWEWALDA